MRIAALVFVVILAGCTRPQAPPRVEPPAARGVAPPRPALLPASDESDAAASGGTLVLSPDCVRVRTPDGRHLLPGFLVRPVYWDATARRLVVGRHRFAAGDRVFLGGSQAPRAVVDALWVVPPAPGCEFDAVWVAGAFDPA